VSNLIEIETSEAEATIAGITAEPPSVVCVYSGRDTRDLRRDFVQQVPVRDVGLARRVLAELHQGDRVQVTVVNEWYEDKCDTYLADFSRIADTKASVSTNGVSGIALNDIKQIAYPSTTDPKTKVQN